MKRYMILLPLIGMAACHKAPAVSADNASANEVAAKVDAAGGGPSKMAPGQYTMTTKVTKVDMPGVPDAAKGMMAQQLNKTTTATICITPEQADKPAASMFSGQGAGNCTYDHFAMSTGSMDARTTCKMVGTTATSTMKGSFAADGFHIDTTTETKGANPMGNMTMAATIDAKRTGDCTGKAG